MILAVVQSERAAVQVVLCSAPVVCVAQPGTLDLTPLNPAPEAASLNVTKDEIVQHTWYINCFLLIPPRCQNVAKKGGSY